jgi:hypothetical protein
MPATFPSHAAAVLPLKLWRPRWFDGVALVVGSAAPDMYYPVVGFVDFPATHNVPALLWFSLPATLVVTWLFRRAAPIVAAHLPARPRWLALPDYGALGRVRHHWYVTVGSALIGAVSHLVWDGFTHYPGTEHGWMVERVPGLTAEPWPGTPVWWLAQHVSTVLGALAALAVAAHVGRRRLLRRWYGGPPPVTRTPWVFWPVAAAVAAPYPLTWPYLPHQWTPYVQGVRMLWAVALGLLAGAAAAALAARRRTSPRVPVRSHRGGRGMPG